MGFFPVRLGFFSWDGEYLKKATSGPGRADLDRKLNSKLELSPNQEPKKAQYLLSSLRGRYAKGAGGILLGITHA